jgi:hypothetical protein
MNQAPSWRRESCSAPGSTDQARPQQLAKELIELRPDLIQVTTTPATAAVLRETHTVPVVFSNVSDPLGSGFVESFARPGGNATGFVNLEDSVAGKWLELLKELGPQTSRVSPGCDSEYVTPRRARTFVIGVAMHMRASWWKLTIRSRRQRRRELPTAETIRSIQRVGPAIFSSLRPQSARNWST